MQKYNFFAFLYGCETWSLTLREEQTEGTWEEGAEENIWTQEWWKNRRFGENYIMKSFINGALRQIYLEW
jgi:hypothetical protein